MAMPRILPSRSSGVAEARAAMPNCASPVMIDCTIWAPLRAELAAAQEREIEHFKRLLGGPANTEALAAFTEGRTPDFSNLPKGW